MSAQTPKPAWIDTTPEETTYELTMFDEGGGSIQGICLDRDEYIALKAHLAAMRGYRYQEEMSAFVNANTYDDKTDLVDPQQLAFSLEIARDMLRDYPALVMAPEFPEEWKPLLIVEHSDASCTGA